MRGARGGDTSGGGVVVEVEGDEECGEELVSDNMMVGWGNTHEGHCEGWSC